MNNMKKILGVLAALSCATTSVLSVSACSNSSNTSGDILKKSFKSCYQVPSEKFGDTGLTKNGDTFDFIFGSSVDNGLKDSLIKATIVQTSGSQIYGIGKQLTDADIPSNLTPTDQADLYAVGVYGKNQPGLTVDSDNFINISLTLSLFKSTKTDSNAISWIKQNDSMIIKLQVPFKAKIDIKDLIKTTNLGPIFMTATIPALAELLKGIKDVNPTASSLTINDVKFKDDIPPTATTATISGIGNYTGDVALTYTRKENDISRLITTTALGDITMAGSTPTINELLTGIKSKNPSASSLTTADIKFKDGTTPSNTTATISGVGNYTGDVTLTYSKTLIDINTIITVTELGPISMEGNSPNFTELLNAIRTVNPQAAELDASSIKFKDGTTPTDTTATISGIGNYTGDVTLTYSKVTVDLNSIITVTNLGSMTFLNVNPTLDELLVGIKAANPDPSVQDLTTADIKFKDGTTPSNTTATISGVGNYTGDVTLTYSKASIDLNTLITNKNIGTFAFDDAVFPSTTSLLPAIKALNPLAKNLLPTDFYINHTEPNIVGIEGLGSYMGRVDFTFTQSKDLNVLIAQKNLGAIVMHTPYPTEYDILTAIIQNNTLSCSNLSIVQDMQLSNITATTANITGINNYTGSFAITYTKQTDLVNIATVIPSNFLGPIAMAGSTPTIDELLTGIQNINPQTINLENSDFVIKSGTTATSTSATISGVGLYNSEITLYYSKT